MDDATPKPPPHLAAQPGQPSAHAATQVAHILAAPLFQALLEAAPDAMVIVDAAGRIVLANGQTERLFGYPRDALAGAPIEILLPEQLHTIHVQHRARYFAAPRTRPMGSGLELQGRRKDGSTFPVEISLSALPTEAGLLVTSVIRDATERKRAADELEHQVHQRTAHLNALLQFSQELLAARSLDAVLQHALDHALELAGAAQCGAIYLADAAAGHMTLRVSVGFSHLPSLRLPVNTGIVGLAFTTRQVQVTHSVDELVTLVPELAAVDPQARLLLFGLPELPSGTLALPLVARGDTIGVLLLLRTGSLGAFAAEAQATLEGLANLTASAIQAHTSASAAATLSSQLAHLEEQQRTLAARLSAAEAAMLQAARLAAVGQLAAAVAHEINNPLYAARNALYLLEVDRAPEQDEQPYLAIARNELARIAGIIERMRDFYRPVRGEMAPVEINNLLEETLAVAGLNMRHGAIRVIFAPTPDLPPVVCSGDQMRQVFLNLILNAIEAMPDRGTLTVRTTAGPTVALAEIQDTGVGIPQAIRERLFEPFFTTKPSGTGLGLSISAHIVTQHGGQIEVESSAETGTTFRIVLPYRPAV